MDQHRAPHVRPRPNPAESDPDEYLVFRPNDIVAGIVYHVVDEQRAGAIDPESGTRSVLRLRRECPSLVVRRAAWATMTNARRLQWLLSESRTVVHVTATGVAVLRAER